MKQALSVPTWLRRAAVYQVNLRTFSERGTIQALREELPFLKELGFSVIYLCPVFEEDTSTDRRFWSTRQKASNTDNPKNPYRINDYFKIDPEYGSMDDLYALIEDAHAQGIRVLLDLVYMHIGPYAPIIHRHPDFVARDEQEQMRYTEYNFPVLNFDCEGLCEYLWSNMTYYLGALDVDGFRCDAADAVPEAFWIECRRRLKTIKPDAVLLNEGYKRERLATAFDAGYAFEWHEELYRVFGGHMTIQQLMQNERERMAAIPTGGLLLRDMDNHDTVTDWPCRAEDVAGHDGMELVTVLNYTFPGIPMLYCGNELADNARVSLFANRFFMGTHSVTDRPRLKTTEAAARRISIVQALNHLRACCDAMQSDDIVWEHTIDEQLLTFRKRGKSSTLLFVGNFGNAPCTYRSQDHINTVLLSAEGIAQDKQTYTLPAHGYLLAQI